MATSGAAGIKVYIGTTATDETTDTYDEIENITSGPEFGDQREIIRDKTLGNARVIKTKGTGDAGSFALTFLYDPDSTAAPGQAALKAASDANNSINYNIKIELADEPSSGPSPAPTTIYAKGIANGFSIDAGTGGPDNSVKATSNIELNTIESITPATDGS